MLSKAILATLAYYDTLDYPLTAFEVWKHLLVLDDAQTFPKTSLTAVERTLETLGLEGRVAASQGFWYLPGQGHLLTERIHREKRAVAKLKRASRLARSCSWLPYIRMIGLTGSLSLKQGNHESDWDFLIVMRSGAVWTGRFFLTIWLTLLGQRRHDKAVPDRACLNCYLTTDHLEVPLRDVFSSHEYRFVYPVIGVETFRAFELANRWMQRYRPHFSLTLVQPFWLRPAVPLAERWQAVLERCLPLTLLEHSLRRFQQHLIRHNPKTQLPHGYILASDEALVFLPEPKGPAIFERFKKRLAEI